MRIPLSILFAVVLSLHTFAAPVPTADVGNESALEVRKTPKAAKKPSIVKAKVSIKKAPVEPFHPVVKAKPLPKPKPLPKKVVAKPAAKKVVSAKKPIVKASGKKVAVPATNPVAKTPVAGKKPVVKASGKKAAVPATNPVAKTPVAGKKPVTGSKTTKPIGKAPTKSSAAKAKPSAGKEPVAVSCPVRTSAKTSTKAKKPKRTMDLLDAFARELTIARRTLFGLIQPRLTEGNEFIGWHGTNTDTAALWKSRGEIVRPTTAEGQTVGKSLDAELGPGLYITDSLSIAESAGTSNSDRNKVPGSVCAIFAKSSVNWRQGKDKVQIPEVIRGNADIREDERQSYIATLPGRSPDTGKAGKTPSILFGPLFPIKGQKTNQMLIVEKFNPGFEAECFDMTGDTSPGAKAFEDAGNKLLYTDASLIEEWGIRKEDVELGKATREALEKTKCPEPVVLQPTA
ncbi:hypothetical protein DFH09DRAFT_1360955 [Mycena vulgaris]|nr:hypothetical protein DFH09DRAFT_1360955 [Mycena vulgaris]